MIFLSYCRLDKSRVVRIHRALASAGFDVWWDQRIRAGEEFRDTIEQKISEADKVIVVWSKHSVKSQFVRDEASRALSLKKLVPIRIDEIRPPVGFGEQHVAECEHDLNALLQALGCSENSPINTTAKASAPKLTKVERLLLANQYRIMNMIDPDDSREHQKIIDCLYEGYLHRLDIFDHINEQIDNTIHSDVFRILQLYRSIYDALNVLWAEPSEPRKQLPFPGFDGNEESSYYAYTNYLLEREGLYKELQSNSGYNSHCPMWPKYVSMLRVWEEKGEPCRISKDEAQEILAAEPDIEALEKHILAINNSHKK